MSDFRKTQYGLTYRGQHMNGLRFATREAVDRYVAGGVTAGNDPLDYAVVHRTVTYGDWAPTTPAPATLDAIRAAR